MHRRLSLTLAFTLTLPSLAFAASGTTVTGSGSQMPAESALLKEERTQRSQGLTDAVTAFQKTDAQFRERGATFLRKRADNRAQCRDDLRRANKNTVLSVTLRCYRSDLSLERDFLLKQHDWLATLPGVTDPIRSIALSRLDLLSDAISTIIQAIDSDVYGAVDDITEARSNLLQKYRLPFAESMTAVRADRGLAAIATTVQLLDSAQTEQATASGSTLQSSTPWATARRCLTAQETELKALLQPQAKDRAMRLSTSLSAVGTCLQSAKALVQPQTGSGSGK